MNFNLLNAEHFLSDVAIALAYLGLAAFCWSLARSRKGWEKLTCFMFGLFILACGLTHANEAYFEAKGICGVTSAWAAGTKIFTALISIATMITAWSRYIVVSMVLVKASAMHGPGELQAQHESLKATNEKIDEVSEKTEFLLKARA